MESEVQTDGWQGNEQDGLWHPKAMIFSVTVGPETDKHEYKSLMVPADKTKKPPPMRPCKDTSEVLKKLLSLISCKRGLANCWTIVKRSTPC